MASKKQTSSKEVQNQGFKLLAEAMYDASKISFSLVFFPVVLLLGGVWLDKRLETTPLFIIIGIFTGVIVGLLKATQVKSLLGKSGGKTNG